MTRVQPSTTGRRCCTFCGSADHIEDHHIGGRNHARWFTLPLCRHHHVEITRALHGSGVDMRHTTDKIVRIARAMQALAVFLWRLAEALMKHDD